MTQLSVVIPVYRSAEGLPELHRRLKDALTELVGEEWEIIYVNDCSPDNSWQVLLQIKEDDERVVLLETMRNGGQQRAVLTGFEHVRGDYVVTMDDDLQQRPEEIRLLYDAIEESGSDVVIGRYPKKKHGLIRRLGTRAVKTVALHTVGIPRNVDLTSFRIIKRPIIDEVIRLNNPSPVVGYLLYKVSPNFKNVEVNHDPRKIGGSTYGFMRLVEYFLQMILDYSDLPLRFVGYLGFSVAVGSFFLGLNYLRQYLGGQIGLKGWATIVLLLTFFSGLVLMSLGIIGIYLVRILQAVNTTPTRRVRKKC